eukprot:357060-Chlamydomonas_euryale.AAC.5
MQRGAHGCTCWERPASSCSHLAALQCWSLSHVCAEHSTACQLVFVCPYWSWSGVAGTNSIQSHRVTWLHLERRLRPHLGCELVCSFLNLALNWSPSICSVLQRPCMRTAPGRPPVARQGQELHNASAA